MSREAFLFLVGRVCFILCKLIRFFKLLEIFTNADGTHCLGAIRYMALLTDDGMAFCYGPPGEQVEFYMER